MLKSNTSQLSEDEYIHTSAKRSSASVCGTRELQNFLASLGSALGCFFTTRTCTVLASSLALINLLPISGGQLSSAGKKKERKKEKKRSLQPTEHYLCSAKWHWQSRRPCVAEHLAAKDPASLSLPPRESWEQSRSRLLAARKTKRF